MKLNKFLFVFVIVVVLGLVVVCDQVVFVVFEFIFGFIV